VAERDTEAELRARALRLLARREHSRQELERKLSPHAGSADVLGDLISSLKAKNQLSEARFAEERARWLARKYGAARIRQDLRARGVSDELVEKVSSAGELARARAILEKKYPVRPKDLKERARRMRFLQGRGFSLEAIRSALGREGEEA
jgi:regulatory protein